MNKQKVKKIFIIMLLLIFAYFLYIIFLHINAARPFDPAFKASNYGMLVLEQEDLHGDTTLRFYCVFDDKDICKACFCEIENVPKEMHLSNDILNGYIRPKIKDNIAYVEYTSLRGLSREEIKNRFNQENVTILKEW
jgi:hypothetical protein